MKKFWSLFMSIIISCCTLTNAQEFNKDLTKSTDIQKISGKYYYIHVVQPKQTLYSIAKLYEINIDTICLINYLPSYEINKGQAIKIPCNICTNYNTVSTTNSSESLQIIDDKVNEITNMNDYFAPNIDISDSISSSSNYNRNLEMLKYNKFSAEKIYPNTIKIFNVALLIPLYYENVDELIIDYNDGKIIKGNSRPFRFIQFYQGARIAIDSLINKGMNVKLYVFDVDEKGDKAQKLIDDNSLQMMDLIIGPFYKKPYDLICKHINKNNNINIINPTQSMKNTYCDNDNSFKVNVEKKLEMTYITNYIIDNYPDANIIIYTYDKNKDADKIKYLTDLLNKYIPKRVKLQNFDIYNFLLDYSASDTTLQDGMLYDSIFIDNKPFTRKELEENTFEFTEFDNSIKVFSFSEEGNDGYSKYLMGGRDNVIISLVKDYSHVLDNVTQLSTFTGAYKIHTFGNQSWTNLELDNTNLNNIDFHFCTNKYINYNSNEVISFIEKFKRKYISEPNESQYAYLGFDTFYFFLNMLYFYGNYFPRYITSFSYNGLESSYFFAITEDSYGFENYYSNIYKIQKFSYNVMPSKDYIWKDITIDLRTFIEKNY